MRRFWDEEHGDVVQYILVLAVIVVILLFSFTRVKAMVKCTTERTVSAVSSIFGSKSDFNYDQCMGKITNEKEDGNETNTGDGSGNNGNTGEIVIDGGGTDANGNTLPPGTNTDSSEMNLTCQNSIAQYEFTIPKSVPPQGSGSHTITIKNKKTWDIWMKIDTTSTENDLQITTNDPYYRKISSGEEVVFKVGWKWNAKTEKTERGKGKVQFSIACQEPAKEELYVPNVTAPQNFKVTGVTDTAISLSWDKVNYASEYYLYRNDVLVYKGSSLSHVDENILPGTTYTYKLFTSETTGTSVFSTLQQKTTGVSPIPPPPKNIRIYNVTDNKFHVVWDRSPKETHYQVFLDGQSKGITYWNDTVQYNLKPNTTYTLEVVAENIYGVSEKSAIMVRTNELGTLANPANFRNINRTLNSQTIIWDPVPGATSYIVYAWGKVYYQGTDTSFNQKNIGPGGCTHFFIYAVNGKGTSSGIHSCLGPLGIHPPMPAFNIAITSVTNTSAKLSWVKGAAAEKTIIKMNGKEIYNDTGSSVNINNLTPNTHYTFEFVSKNITAESRMVSNTFFTTNDTYDDVSDLQATCQNESYSKVFTFPAPTKIGDGGTFIIDTTNSSPSDLTIQIKNITKKGDLFAGQDIVKLEYDTTATKIKPSEKFSIPIRWFIDTKDESKVKNKTGEIEVNLTTSC